MRAKNIERLTKYFVLALSATSRDRHSLGDPATVLVNGKAAGSVFAHHLDRQLKTRRFLFWFPTPLQPGDVVGIRQGPDHYVEALYMPSPAHGLAEMAYLVELPDWAIDSIERSEKAVRFGGWILPSNNRSHLEVCMNNRVVRDLTLSPVRTDVAAAWEPVVALSRPYSFEGRAEIGSDEDDWELALRESGCSLLLNSIWIPGGKPKFPVPDEKRRHRVHGKSNELHFLRIGFTGYHRILRVIDTFLNSSATRLNILDWGCGCAGVGRFLVQDPRWNYTGIDIDPDNIGWSRQNIAYDRFEVGPLRPPTRFGDDAFDVIFGVSVFTHLREADQFSWLAELARILSPGGIGIFTILGAQAAAKLPPLQHHEEFKSSGFLFTEDRHEIGQLVGEELYYGVAYHHFGYLATQWSRYFDLLAYIPAGYSHQDIVVVRPKK